VTLRCYDFRDPAYACNKRQPGSGCAAIDGYNRMHAVLSGSDHCIATHPSDMAVAMVALDAVVHIEGSAGQRTVPVGDFHLLPGHRQCDLSCHGQAYSQAAHHARQADVTQVEGTLHNKVKRESAPQQGNDREDFRSHGEVMRKPSAAIGRLAARSPGVQIGSGIMAGWNSAKAQRNTLFHTASVLAVYRSAWQPHKPYSPTTRTRWLWVSAM
jgi:FAD binding domain in molybdopterin dehydrogenase